jgi:hypothetical protein
MLKFSNVLGCYELLSIFHHLQHAIGFCVLAQLRHSRSLVRSSWILRYETRSTPGARVHVISMLKCSNVLSCYELLWIFIIYNTQLRWPFCIILQELRSLVWQSSIGFCLMTQDPRPGPEARRISCQPMLGLARPMRWFFHLSNNAWVGTMIPPENVLKMVIAKKGSGWLPSKFTRRA